MGCKLLITLVLVLTLSQGACASDYDDHLLHKGMRAALRQAQRQRRRLGYKRVNGTDGLKCYYIKCDTCDVYLKNKTNQPVIVFEKSAKRVNTLDMMGWSYDGHKQFYCQHCMDIKKSSMDTLEDSSSEPAKT